MSIQNYLEKDNKRVINAWCWYDVANSVYNLIIATALFPIYYQEVIKQAYNSDEVMVLGTSFKATVVYDYAMSLAYLVIVFLTPILSGIADYGGRKRFFMFLFTLIGALSCSLMNWFSGYNIEFGLLLVALAAIGFSGSQSFYNAFLPQIASPQHHDRISARGYAWGYLGSVVLMLFCIFTIENTETFGFAGKLDALRFSFLEVGIWWLGMALISLAFLRDFPSQLKKGESIVSKGWEKLKHAITYTAKQKDMSRFLWAFFFFSMGVQTIMMVAMLFASEELKMEGGKLIMTLLILQLVGVVGAIFFARVSQWIGNKKAIIIMLFIWLGVCISAYFITTEMQFFIIAAGVGLVMGGIQSQSRSAFSKMLPANTDETASFFSLFNLTEKLAVVIGMFGFGVVEHISGSMRNSALLMGIFFILGIVVMLVTPMQHTKNAVNN